MKKVIATNRSLSIGMDVDKKKSVVVVLDPLCGELLFEGSIPHDRPKWERFIARFPECTLTGYYEAGYSGFWLCRTLQSLGVFCHVVCPNAIPKESILRQRKNDRRDALTLAQLICMPPRSFVRVPTETEERERELIRTREQFIKQRNRVINQVKAKLALHHISYDESMDSRNKSWGQMILESIGSIPILYLVVECLLSSLSNVNDQLKILEKALRALSREDKYKESCIRLQQVPGVGEITAMAFLTEVFRPEDFDSPKKLHAHLGLVPSEHSSGGTVRHGHILHWGPPHLRRLLVEAAWTWVERDPDAGRIFEKLCRGRLKKKAIVAMARRLSTSLWAMTVKEEDYNFHWKEAA